MLYYRGNQRLIVGDMDPNDLPKANSPRASISGQTLLSSGNGHDLFLQDLNVQIKIWFHLLDVVDGEAMRHVTPSNGVELY